ncbi:hypothetical protein M4951_22670 [Blastopirellula sp. J2-11]|uniref:hypothetical protein n=1 Tax=Blastopirellula sp. J2-11 TaxID=2943192 RepID=UPI0021C8AF97|nr:hypothetical protein [Blastopirellula sp. J2-11]UUO06152.1 hypothetical protein M4951_22670 [Blastopirellula sp. J2-11]
MSSSQPRPVYRVAPLGELRAYTISEEELHELARGGDLSLDLNFSVALLSVFATILATFLTVPLEGTVFTGFLTVGTVTLIAGVYLLIKGIRNYRSTNLLVQTIKNRLPPAEGIQEHTLIEEPS